MMLSWPVAIQHYTLEVSLVLILSPQTHLVSDVSDVSQRGYVCTSIHIWTASVPAPMIVSSHYKVVSWLFILSVNITEHLLCAMCLSTHLS